MKHTVETAILLLSITSSTQLPAQTIGEIYAATETTTAPGNVDESQSRFSSVAPEFNDIEEIGIQRTACFGTCPAYEFRITADGSVRYAGFQFVENEGERVGTVDPWYLKNVFEYIHEIDFASFQHTYSAPVTDNPTVYTMVKFKNGTVKTVSNYANSGPIELWALEQVIDQLQNNVEWEETP